MKLSVPISIKTINEETLPTYLEQIKSVKAMRVFLCGVGNIYAYGISEDLKKRLKMAIDAFHENGLEVGIWLGTLGHGAALVGDFEKFPSDRYASLTGIAGDQPPHGLCPLDENLLEDYAAAVKTLAQLGPDILMTDDDLRISRGNWYYFGCFCEKHLELMYAELGERPSREELGKKIYVGGPNKYRDAYLKATAQGLTGFVARMRRAIDEVDESIRFAVCTPGENWDITGLHMPDYAKVFAGKNKPLLRTYGAPYWFYMWPNGLAHVIEASRMQAAALKGTGIEVMAEGDVYPRPRYNVPSRVLELYYYALIADGNFDGMLGYIFDYYQKPEYETSYLERHIKTEPLRRGVEQLFAGKKAAGIYNFHVQHKVRDWVLPEGDPLPRIASRISQGHKPSTYDMLCNISIPTTFEESDYPCLITGENARTASVEVLKNGAILDAAAAMILQEKGIDTGIRSCEEATFLEERYLAPDDAIPNVDCGGLRRITCDEKVTVLSCFEDGSPSSYTYENAAGNRFYVLAYDQFLADHKEKPILNFLNNYYRQADLVKAIEWMCGHRLPVTCLRNPNLYVYTAKGSGAMSVLLLNIFMDGIDQPVLQLDGEYKHIRAVNCTATLDGDKVYLSEMQPYSMAAIEVSN